MEYSLNMMDMVVSPQKINMLFSLDSSLDPRVLNMFLLEISSERQMKAIGRQLHQKWMPLSLSLSKRTSPEQKPKLISSSLSTAS